MTAKTIESKVNTTWKRICEKNTIPQRIMKSFVTSNSDIPKFYHLIKTHKPSNQGVKIRPIVSNVNGPTHRIAWLLSRLLKPLLKEVPAHLESSLQLINTIKARETSTNLDFPYPFSLDVVSLYTSIPVSEAITNVSRKMGAKINHFTKEDIVDLLKVITDNVYFTFDSRIFLQVRGLPMGSSVSGILAILFMDTLERQTLSSYNFISQYNRYVDDVYLQTVDEKHATEFHALMNTQHDNIKFEIEKPMETQDGHSLSLLDFNITIKRDGETSFDFYRKEAKRPLFVHHRSWLPQNAKRHFIINERRRIRQRCTSHLKANERDKELDAILEINGYPEDVIEATKLDRIQQHTEQQRPTEWLYFSIPYVCDALDNRLRKVFKDQGLNVRISHKSQTLRNVLNPTHTSKTCKIKECCINNPKKCFQRGVVYEVTCKQCQSSYIGSTIRHLHDRIKEHFNDPKSSVFSHFSTCSDRNIVVNIIARSRDTVNLRLLEAIYIKSKNPSINSRDEHKELRDLLF